MLFHSVEFFFLFSGTFIGYWLIPHHRLRMLWLLGASFGFYGSWNPWLMLVVVFSAAFDFLIGQRIEADRLASAAVDDRLAVRRRLQELLRCEGRSHYAGLSGLVSAGTGAVINIRLRSISSLATMKQNSLADMSDQSLSTESSSQMIMTATALMRGVFSSVRARTTSGVSFVPGMW